MAKTINPVIADAVKAVQGVVNFQDVETFYNTAKLKLQDGSVLKIQVKQPKSE